MLQRAAQIAGRRDRIVVQKIDDFAPRGAQRGVALHGRLPSAGQQDFNLAVRAFQLLRGGHGAHLGLIRPRRNDDGDRMLAHEAKAQGRRGLETAALWLDDFNDAVGVNADHLVLAEIH